MNDMVNYLTTKNRLLVAILAFILPFSFAKAGVKEDGKTISQGWYVGIEGVHHHGGAIRHRKLFKVAPRAALRAAPRPGGIPFCGAVQLGHELVVAVERSLGDRQKERRIAQKPQVFFFRQDASPAHIAEVARQLQGEVPKPQRPRQGTLPAQGGGQVLEQGQRKQRSGQPRVKDAFFRRATGAPPNQKRAVPGMPDSAGDVS